MNSCSSPPVTVRRRCVKCGHEQDVQSATSMKVNDVVRYYFGSAYDFCDKCDGPMESVGTPKEPPT